MKINSDIQKIIDSKAKECAKDAEVAVLEAWNTWYAGDARRAWYARNARNSRYARGAWYAFDAWRRYENQF